MIFGSTKTKLDYILELGFKRIDEAVEAVIDRLSITFRSLSKLPRLNSKDIIVKDDELGDVRFHTWIDGVDKFHRVDVLLGDDEYISVPSGCELDESDYAYFIELAIDEIKRTIKEDKS